MDYARVDLCIAGGLTEARKIAGWCETHYIHPALHNPLGPVSTAACAHLCFASPLVGCKSVHVLRHGAHRCFPRAGTFFDGHLLPPEGPGLGVELNDNALVEGEPAPAREFGLCAKTAPHKLVVKLDDSSGCLSVKRPALKWRLSKTCILAPACLEG